MTLHCSFQDHVPALERYALRLTKDEGAAEDLVQDTCMRMLARKSPDAKIDNPCGYMISMMHNIFVDKTRRADYADTLPIDDVDPIARDAPQSLKMTCRETLSAIARLPPDYADVLTRHACDGQSYVEIAKDLDIPQGTVMSRINRARKALCEELNFDAKAGSRAFLDDV